jgi:hypothetical protein
MGGKTVLEPNKTRINPVGQICPTRAVATALEPNGDRINLVGQIQIYLTWVGYVQPGLAAKPLESNDNV